MLDRKDFLRIDFIFVLSDNYIAFQNVSKSKLLSKRRVLALGAVYEYQDDCSEVVINDLPDAFYDESNDTLYFKRLESITSIFRGIDQLYREATEEETTQFLNNDLKKLLFGIEQRFYTTPVGGEKRIANSVIPLA